MRVIRFDDVIALTGLSKSTIYRRMEEKQFPKSISLGGRSVGWYEHEVKEWLNSLKPSDT
ncbi:AlpA family phage regulatory protein [Cardiobacteriales bacterium ML27]|uniref:AlpA family phage regulatory protein n=2 Tax=Ostreibacterium oceani TaxID=2654998 RepID=A0A6N7EZM4_9GAMM|nr:AlpA family phage regulatory protein [Ostreibacterium oceani]